jgi:hypothetical protein
MSVSTEVQRTLVKSPPELWSELSNPEALARHLSELGEIRITSVEPETKVEWEADSASGVVHLKQSGWGTKVTLSVTRAAPAGREAPLESETIAEAGLAAVEPRPIAAVEPEPEPETASAEPPVAKPVTVVEPEFDAEPVAVVEPELDAEPVAVVEPEPVDVESEPVVEPEPILEPEPRLGFFARLFRRRKTEPHELVDLQPELEAGAEPEPEPEIEVVALATPEPIYPVRAVEPEPTHEPASAEPASDLGAELASVEAQMAEQTTELLTGVLDRLGAAHHRPFSRG